MGRGGADPNKKAKNTKKKNLPFGYPPYPSSKNWDTNCFPGLGKKPDGLYVGGEL